MRPARESLVAQAVSRHVGHFIGLLPVLFTLILLVLTVQQLAVNLMPAHPYVGSGVTVDMTWEDPIGGPTRDAGTGGVPPNGPGAITLTLIPQSFDPSKRTISATGNLSAPRGFVSGLRVQRPGDDFVQPLTPADDSLTLMLVIDEGPYRSYTPVSVEQLRDRSAFTPIPLEGIPLVASPQQYPSDEYSLFIQASLFAVPPLSEIKNLVDIAVGPSLSLADKKVLLHVTSGSQFLSLSIQRDTPNQVYVYAMTLAPLALVVLLSQVMLRRRGTNEAGSLDLIVAMAAAVLTLLPLRAVLVPKELDGVSITRVDLLLALQLLLLILLATLAHAAAPFGPNPRR